MAASAALIFTLTSNGGVKSFEDVMSAMSRNTSSTSLRTEGTRVPHPYIKLTASNTNHTLLKLANRNARFSNSNC